MLVYQRVAHRILVCYKPGLCKIMWQFMELPRKTFLTLNQAFDVQSSRHVDIGQSFTLSIIHTVAADHPLKNMLFDKTVSFFFLPTPKHPIKTDVHPILCHDFMSNKSFSGNIKPSHEKKKTVHPPWKCLPIWIRPGDTHRNFLVSPSVSFGSQDRPLKFGVTELFKMYLEETVSIWWVNRRDLPWFLSGNMLISWITGWFQTMFFFFIFHFIYGIILPIDELIIFPTR